MKSGQIVLRSGCLSLLALCVGAYALSQRKPAEQETNKLKLQPLLGQPLPMWEKALGKPSKIVPPKTSSQAIEERIYKIRGNSTTSEIILMIDKETKVITSIEISLKQKPSGWKEPLTSLGIETKGAEVQEVPLTPEGFFWSVRSIENVNYINVVPNDKVIYIFPLTGDESI